MEGQGIDMILKRSVVAKFLLYLREHEDSYIAEATKFLGTSYSTLYYIYPELVEMGLVKARKDGRAVRVRLTRKGRSVAKRLHELDLLLEGVAHENKGEG